MFQRLLATALVLALSSLAPAQPLTTAFTFQGELKNSGTPATGTYDLQFRLYDAASAGSQLGPTLCSDNIAVAQGLFTTQLDFGAQFSGQQRFLEIAVRADTGLNCSNSTGFTTLAPRQPLSASPNAIYSLNAASATTAATAANASQLNGQSASFYTNAANLTGTLPAADLSGTYSAQLNLSNASNIFQGSFSGSGANLTGIPYAAITGAPTPVLLQASTPGSNQSGNLHVSGFGTFGAAVSIASPHADLPLVVGGHARISDDGSDGDALRIGGSSSHAALTSEVGQALLNLDMNFHVSNSTTSVKGAAVRLDSRAGLPAIQFFTRAAGSTVENNAMRIADDGSVAIGAASQSAAFQVSDLGNGGQDITGYFAAMSTANAALWGDAQALSGLAIGVNATSSSTSGMGVYSTASATTGQTYGVLSYNYSTGGTALYGNSQASTGTTYGAYIQDYSSSGTALFADTTATSGTTYAVYGIGHSPAGYAGYFDSPGADTVFINNSGSGRGLHVTTASDTAVWAVATSAFAGIDGRNSSPTGRAIYALNSATTGSGYGLYAQSSSSSGTAVYAFAQGSGISYGVYGASQSGANGYGVFASGNLGSNGVKSFRIDHPDDPAHKYLLHYSTESPEVLNAYRGTVTLNQQGEAIVELPPYFAKINKSPTYQLTPVGAPMPLLHIAAKISQSALDDGAKAGPDQPAPLCSFTIAGGAPNAEVCWRVEAVRNDPWVQQHGAPTEVNKQGAEDGTYQHPDLYHQPAEMGLNKQ